MCDCFMLAGRPTKAWGRNQDLVHCRCRACQQVRGRSPQHGCEEAQEDCQFRPKASIWYCNGVVRQNHCLHFEWGYRAGTFQNWKHLTTDRMCWSFQFLRSSNVNCHFDCVTVYFLFPITGEVLYSLHGGSCKCGEVYLLARVWIGRVAVPVHIWWSHGPMERFVCWKWVLFYSLEYWRRFTPFYAIPNGCKKINSCWYWDTAQFSPGFYHLLLKIEKPGMMRSGSWRMAYWRL